MPSGKVMKEDTSGVWAIVVVVALILMFLVAFTLGTKFPQSKSLSQTASQHVVTEITPIDDGNGIFYFPVTGEDYRRSLATFYKSGKSQHCDLQGFTESFIDPATYNARTVTTGFVLHCHDIAVEAQSITVP